MIPLPRINISSAKITTAKRTPAPAQAGPETETETDWCLIICGAKTRTGVPCRMPPVKGKTRCRMHGGTTSASKQSGAPKGNQNAFVHGYYSAAARAERKRLAGQIRWLKNEMREMRKLKGL